MSYPVDVLRAARGLLRQQKHDGATLSCVMSLQGMRKRMPLLVFILLAIFCLLALGIACACASDHPMQNVDRALSAIPAAAPLVEVWTFSFAALVIFASVGVRQRRADKDTSPAALQCFLF